MSNKDIGAIQKENMKVAVTGHTRGIGKEIANYFVKHGFELVGFSKSTGYNIRDPEIRKKIVEESKECSVFVNNAMAMVDDSQTSMLKEIYESWNGQPKLIINVSSISGDHVWRENKLQIPQPVYSKIKHDQDVFCASRIGLPRVLNLKPGMVDTDLTRIVPGKPKLDVSVISTILDFVLSNRPNFAVSSITFFPTIENVAKKPQ